MAAAEGEGYWSWLFSRWYGSATETPAVANPKLTEELQQKIGERFIGQFHYALSESLLVPLIRGELSDIENARGKIQKTIMARRVFQYLVEHRYMVWKHEKVAKTIRSKIMRFAKEDKVQFAAAYQMLFPGCFLHSDLEKWDGTWGGLDKLPFRGKIDKEDFITRSKG